MKAWLLLGLIILSTVAADVLTSLEMRRHGEIRDFGARGLGRAAAVLVRRKYLILQIPRVMCWNDGQESQSLSAEIKLLS